MSSQKWNPSRAIPSKAQWQAFKKEKKIKSNIATVQMGNAFHNYHAVALMARPFRSRVQENRRVLAQTLDTYISAFESKYGQEGGGDMQDAYNILQKVKTKLTEIYDLQLTPSREQWETYVDEMEMPDEIIEGSDAPDLSKAFANYDQWRNGKDTGIGRSTPEECYDVYSTLLTELVLFRTRLLMLQTDYAAKMTVDRDMEIIKAYVNQNVDMYYRLAHAVTFFTEKLRTAQDLFNELTEDNTVAIDSGYGEEFRLIGTGIVALKSSKRVDKQIAKAIEKVYQTEQIKVDNIVHRDRGAAKLLQQMKVAVQKVDEACIQQGLWGNEDSDNESESGNDNEAGLHSINLNSIRTVRNLNNNKKTPKKSRRKNTFQDAEVYWV